VKLALALLLLCAPGCAPHQPHDTGVARYHASLFDTAHGVGDRTVTFAVQALPSGRYATPAWVAESWPDVVWCEGRAMRDRPDSTLNGWSVWREAVKP